MQSCVPWIKEIVVPISENYVKEGQQILKEFLHTKVRHRSIFSGIQALTVDGRSPPSVVILHDAVRPFVDEETLRCVTKVANKHGVSIYSVVKIINLIMYLNTVIGALPK
ncbi:D-ribitol-5-phosphate cytidylyltransferase [Acropora cervicornis]|uniref:D-ribitol-5-phosphate cytidylyltransferase n=1 Tax=Acropora cervicornis TaxID=6130 RepID=A0AAD9Q6Z0_ACRCE|nr:D-ribitol-5-phosphate cytidylyltransferase [Acropora cervicornis]